MALRAKSIDHINMSVKDLRRSVEFYCKLFGFKVLKDQQEYNSKIIGDEHVKLCIYEEKDLKIGSGLNHFGLYVDNFAEIEEQCKAMGVTMPYGVVTWSEGTRSIYIVDPDGYEIELAEIEGGGLSRSQ